MNFDRYKYTYTHTQETLQYIVLCTVWYTLISNIHAIPRYPLLCFMLVTIAAPVCTIAFFR